LLQESATRRRKAFSLEEIGFETHVRRSNFPWLLDSEIVVRLFCGQTRENALPII
jgi:hypothetical protein